MFEEALYEGFGPNGVALMIEALTDNKNRTVSDIKHILSKHGGSMAGPGSVQWQFEHRGIVRFSADEQAKVSDWEGAQMSLMDAGVLDIHEESEGVTLITTMEDLQKVQGVVHTLPIETFDAGLEWVAKESMDVDEETMEKIEKLYDALDDHDDVRSVYMNV